MENILERMFKLKEHNTDVRTEVIAGLSTFMTMAYILIVHPSIMKDAGMPVGAVTTATALISGIITLFMAFYTNLPFALAPAMGSNAFMAYTLVAGGILNWQQGITLTLVSGIIFVLFTVFGLRELVIKMLPKNLKFAIGTTVGLYIAQLGFKNAGLITAVNGQLKIGDLTTPSAILALIGILITAVMMAYKVKGALLWGMLITTIIGIPMGITTIPDRLISLPPSMAPIAFKFDFAGALKLAYIPFIFTFFVGDFFSTLGTVLGVSAKAGMLDENGNLPGIEKPFLVDSIGTVIGAFSGLTVVTTYIESAAGVEAGGRTGLTSLTTGLAFLAMLFFVPVAMMIPTEATAAALILIGLLMLPGIRQIDFEDFTELFPAFITMLFGAYTFSLANGISAGIIMYVFTKLATGRAKDIHWGLYILCIPLLYYFIAL